MRVSSLLKPVVVLFLPVGVSMGAWLIPGQSEPLRGFATRAIPTLGGCIVLALWYGLCFCSFQLGRWLGNAVPPVLQTNNEAHSKQIEKYVCIMLTGLSVIGVAYCLYQAATTVDIWASLTEGTGNQLVLALDGQAGISTLRYTTVLSAPISVFLYARQGVYPICAALNIALLLVNSLFASRLAILMAALVAVFLYVRQRPEARVRAKSTCAVLAVLFLVLSLLNGFRNSNFYEGQGITNPLSSNTYQLLTYAGVPFQVSIAVASSMGSGTYPDISATAYPPEVLLPTFLRGKTVDGQNGFASESPPVGNARYSGQVDVPASLTTNSAFADVASSYGVGGLLFTLPLLVLAGAVYSHFSGYSSYLSAAAAVALYGLAEMWRILLFNQGILVYLLLIAPCLYAVATLSVRFRVSHVSSV